MPATVAANPSSTTKSPPSSASHKCRQNHSATSNRMNASRPTRPRVQLWMLRIFIFVMLTGLPGALLPEVAFLKFSWLMCYGKQPMTPLTIYLSGNAGYAFTALAILVWVISLDLPSYQPLVRTIGWVLVIAGPAYFSIDLQCPLPLWWTLIDSLGCLLLGAGILWAAPRSTPDTGSM